MKLFSKIFGSSNSRKLKKLKRWMRWQMTWGHYEEKLLDGTIDATQMPFLQSRPDLTPEEGEIVEAFQFLTSSRNVGMAVGAIPFGEIAQYAEMTSQIDFWGFILLVQTLDAKHCLPQREM